jgi:uncharacterized membrane protein YjgN (DUF898 family)
VFDLRYSLRKTGYVQGGTRVQGAHQQSILLSGLLAIFTLGLFQSYIHATGPAFAVHSARPGVHENKSMLDCARTPVY